MNSKSLLLSNEQRAFSCAVYETLLGEIKNSPYNRVRMEVVRENLCRWVNF
ncbi:hypothetical protein [Alteribacillus sp. HJP-4]|uniref:hypothetical protein n=1 Tax=Alteribacillus sp. HJP-4 TaxID=2775394 RepID=UPI0035CD2DFC